MFPMAILLAVSFFTSNILAARKLCVDENDNPGFPCTALNGGVCSNGVVADGEKVDSCYYTTTDDNPCGTVLIDKNSKCNSSCRKILGDLTSDSLLENHDLISGLAQVFQVNDTTPTSHMKAIRAVMDLKSKSRSNYVQPYIGICVPVLNLTFNEVVNQFALDETDKDVLTDQQITDSDVYTRSYYVSILARWKKVAAGLIGQEYNRERCNTEILANDGTAGTCKNCKDSNFFTYASYYNPYPAKVVCVSTCEDINGQFTEEVDKQSACGNAIKWDKSESSCRWNSDSKLCESFKNGPKNQRCNSLWFQTTYGSFYGPSLKWDDAQVSDALKVCDKCKNSDFFSFNYFPNTADATKYTLEYACEPSCGAFLNDTKLAALNTSELCDKADAVTDKKTGTTKSCNYIDLLSKSCVESVSPCEYFIGTTFDECKKCTDYRYISGNILSAKFQCLKKCGDVTTLSLSASDQKKTCDSLSKPSGEGCTWTFDKVCKSDKDLPKPEGWNGSNNAVSSVPSFLAAFGVLFLALSYLL